MVENGIQKSLEEQLSQLETEQKQAEQIYKQRIELGLLNTDPASLQVLAQTILDRKLKIDELRVQLAPNRNNNENSISEEQNEVQEETALVEYHKNPIIRFLQKIVHKMENFSERLEQKNTIRNNGRGIGPKIKSTKWEEYQEMVDTSFSREKKGMESKGQNNEHQAFVDKLSGNGAYSTYKAKSDNEEKIEPKSKQDIQKTEDEYTI